MTRWSRYFGYSSVAVRALCVVRHADLVVDLRKHSCVVGRPISARQLTGRGRRIASTRGTVFRRAILNAPCATLPCESNAAAVGHSNLYGLLMRLMGAHRGGEPVTAHARNGCKVTPSRAHCLSNDDRLPFMPEHSRRFLRSTREHPFWANRFSGLASYSAAPVVVITSHCKSFHGTPFLSRGCVGQHQNLCTRFGFRHGIAATAASSEVRSRLSGYCRKNRALRTRASS
jgi:hypothetical protein